MTVPSPGANCPATLPRAASTAPSPTAGQAAVAVAVASDAGESAPAAWLPLYLAATLVWYSQVHIGMPFASHVGLGAVSGALCGWAVWRSAGPGAIRSARGLRAAGRTR